MRTVADDVLQLVPPPFHRVEFRTVGRQRQQVDPRRQVRILRPRVKPGLIPDDHMFGRRITVGELLQGAPAEPQTDRRHEAQLRPALDHLRIRPASAACGQFVNGEWYVVGLAAIEAISPKPLYGTEIPEIELDPIELERPVALRWFRPRLLHFLRIG